MMPYVFRHKSIILVTCVYRFESIVLKLPCAINALSILTKGAAIRNCNSRSPGNCQGSDHRNNRGSDPNIEHGDMWGTGHGFILTPRAVNNQPCATPSSTGNPERACSPSARSKAAASERDRRFLPLPHRIIRQVTITSANKPRSHKPHPCPRIPPTPKTKSSAFAAARSGAI